MLKVSLKAARINAGFNQNEAAKEIGVCARTLSQYERGIAFPNVNTIKKIEQLYNINYDNINFLA